MSMAAANTSRFAPRRHRAGGLARSGAELGIHAQPREGRAGSIYAARGLAQARGPGATADGHDALARMPGTSWDVPHPDRPAPSSALTSAPASASDGTSRSSWRSRPGEWWLPLVTGCLVAPPRRAGAARGVPGGAVLRASSGGGPRWLHGSHRRSWSDVRSGGLSRGRASQYPEAGANHGSRRQTEKAIQLTLGSPSAPESPPSRRSRRYL